MWTNCYNFPGAMRSISVHRWQWLARIVRLCTAIKPPCFGVAYYKPLLRYRKHYIHFCFHKQAIETIPLVTMAVTLRVLSSTLFRSNKKEPWQNFLWMLFCCVYRHSVDFYLHGGWARYTVCLTMKPRSINRLIYNPFCAIRLRLSTSHEQILFFIDT